MNKQLIEDSHRLVQDHVSPITGIELHTLSPVDCRPMLSILEHPELEYERQVHLLGIFIILSLAADRHLESSEGHPDLTRSILDGDYMYSLYLQFAIQYRELDLVAYLAPDIKRMQIRRSLGDFAHVDLTSGFRQFLAAERKERRRASKAI